MNPLEGTHSSFSYLSLGVSSVAWISVCIVQLARSKNSESFVRVVMMPSTDGTARMRRTLPRNKKAQHPACQCASAPVRGVAAGPLRRQEGVEAAESQSLERRTAEPPNRLGASALRRFAGPARGIRYWAPFAVRSILKGKIQDKSFVTDGIGQIILDHIPSKVHETFKWRSSTLTQQGECLAEAGDGKVVPLTADGVCLRNLHCICYSSSQGKINEEAGRLLIVAELGVQQSGHQLR